jgi:hypothetical protein
MSGVAIGALLAAAAIALLFALVWNSMRMESDEEAVNPFRRARRIAALGFVALGFVALFVVVAVLT